MYVGSKLRRRVFLESLRKLPQNVQYVYIIKKKHNMLARRYEFYVLVARIILTRECSSLVRYYSFILFYLFIYIALHYMLHYMLHEIHRSLLILQYLLLTTQNLKVRCYIAILLTTLLHNCINPFLHYYITTLLHYYSCHSNIKFISSRHPQYPLYMAMLTDSYYSVSFDSAVRQLCLINHQ